ncbi:MAG: DUF2971 domain-containing protein [Pseudomonadota bacterium]|nr:DUF2971 domain-containing protein [Pseudomonadota bacterium]
MNICEKHNFGGLLPCPYPGCPNGTANDCVTQDPGTGKAITHERAFFTDVEQQPRYFWHTKDMPFALGANHLARGEMARLNAEKVDLIYHYTTVDALQKIIESQSLWLTDYAYLNDSSEVQHGLQIAHEALRDFGSDQVIAKIFANVVDSPIELLPRLCVACFSLDGDSLSQWRAYSRGSSGVAIGFELTQFFDGIGYPRQANLSRVVYDDDLKRCMLRNCFSYFEQAWKLDAAADPRHIESYDNLLRGVFFELVVLCKDIGFQDERECRLVYHEDPGLFSRLPLKPAPKSFRVSGPMLVPYTTSAELDCITDPQQFPIGRVVVGPHPHMNVIAAGIREFLQFRGYEKVPVDISTIPFR